MFVARASSGECRPPSPRLQQGPTCNLRVFFFLAFTPFPRRPETGGPAFCFRSGIVDMLLVAPPPHAMVETMFNVRLFV